MSGGKVQQILGFGTRSKECHTSNLRWAGRMGLVWDKCTCKII